MRLFQLYMEAAPVSPTGVQTTSRVEKAAGIEAQAREAEEETLDQTKRLQRSVKEMMTYLMPYSDNPNTKAISADLERLYKELEKDGGYQKTIEAARTTQGSESPTAK